MKDMQTIRIRVNDKAYKNLIKILSKFSKEEIQVITENNAFISIQQYLELRGMAIMRLLTTGWNPWLLLSAALRALGFQINFLG